MYVVLEVFVKDSRGVILFQIQIMVLYGLYLVVQMLVLLLQQHVLLRLFHTVVLFGILLLFLTEHLTQLLFALVPYPVNRHHILFCLHYVVFVLQFKLPIFRFLLLLLVLLVFVILEFTIQVLSMTIIPRIFDTF